MIKVLTGWEGKEFSGEKEVRKVESIVLRDNTSNPVHHHHHCG